MNSIQAVAKFVYPRRDFVEMDDFFLAVSLDDEHDFLVKERLLSTTSEWTGGLRVARFAIPLSTLLIPECQCVISFCDKLRMNEEMSNGVNAPIRIIIINNFKNQILF